MMWRRRKSVVNARQQIWFGLEVVAVGIGFNLLCAFFLFIPPMSEWFGGEEPTQWLLEALMKVIFLKWPLVMTSMAVLLVFGILMSHRLAGPLFGLAKTLDAWRKGDRSARVRFRKYDYLISVMEPLNGFLSVEEQRCKRVKEALAAAEKATSVDGARASVREALQAMDEVEKDL